MGLLGNLNTLLNQTFPNYENVFNTTVESHKLEPFELILQGDPIERAAQVSRRVCNIIEFLKIALSYPYSTPKLIHPTKILSLVQRGLGINLANSGSSPNIDTMFFGHFLPQIQTKLLELLEVLIDICHTHLRMHFRLITDLLLGTLKNTKGSAADGSQIQFINLRSKVYEITMLWVTTFVDGSLYDLIIEHLIKNIFEDIKICQTDICLVSAPLSKKSPGSKFGHLLKPSLLKNIFNSILEIGVQICEKRIIMQQPYSDWHNHPSLHLMGPHISPAGIILGNIMFFNRIHMGR
ncbi:hypothetical protein ACLKA7_007891 [Drosophila subpalustris]